MDIMLVNKILMTKIFFAVNDELVNNGYPALLSFNDILIGGVPYRPSDKGYMDYVGQLTGEGKVINGTCVTSIEHLTGNCIYRAYDDHIVTIRTRLDPFKHVPNELEAVGRFVTSVLNDVLNIDPESNLTETAFEQLTGIRYSIDTQVMLNIIDLVKKHLAVLIDDLRERQEELCNAYRMSITMDIGTLILKATSWRDLYRDLEKQRTNRYIEMESMVAAIPDLDSIVSENSRLRQEILKLELEKQTLEDQLSMTHVNSDTLTGMMNYETISVVARPYCGTKNNSTNVDSVLETTGTQEEALPTKPYNPYSQGNGGSIHALSGLRRKV